MVLAIIFFTLYQYIIHEYIYRECKLQSPPPGKWDIQEGTAENETVLDTKFPCKYVVKLKLICIVKVLFLLNFFTLFVPSFCVLESAL